MLKYSAVKKDSSGRQILCINRICGAGLFSNFTTLLYDLIECRRLGIEIVGLSAGIGMELFRPDLRQDPLKILLRQPPRDWAFSELPIISEDILEDCHIDYLTLDYLMLKPYVKMFFTPSKRVMSALMRLSSKIGLSVADFDCIYFRGTDKYTEVDHGDPSNFALTYSSFNSHWPRASKLLLQTDDYAAFVKLSEIYPFAVYADSLPMSTGPTGVHYQISNDKKLQFAIDMTAINFLIARANILVTGTGNMSLWQALYRPSMDGFCQVNTLINSTS